MLPSYLIALVICVVTWEKAGGFEGEEMEVCFVKCL